ncbi:hypothetical protein Goshw_000492, partial [Gossypium schwendimanii]|nr:hypothetical protein [Gossypium schwendimanii]
MCSVFDTELWGILDGLTLLQDRDFNRILIQTDSLEIVHANSNSGLVKRIQQRLRNIEHWVARHILREANLVVNQIVKM